MAHMVRAERYKEEFSTEDDLEIVRSTRKAPVDTDKYIESEWF
jgi:hypothetical protein